MLLIKVDFREKELIALLQLKMMNDAVNSNIKLKVDNLKIGDIAFVKVDENENEINEELVLFERKSLNDLASSIKDGRYAEQSFRLDGYRAVSNHNIVYLIEGDLSKYRENKYTRINKKTLLSSMFSILYYKGFSVVRTMNALETCDLISSWAEKMEREMAVKKSSVKTPYYLPAFPGCKIQPLNIDARENTESMQIECSDGEIQMNQVEQSQQMQQSQQSQQPPSYDYCGVLKVKKEKNANVTPENIGVIMLSTIPGISSKTAIVIMNEFKTIGQLIKSFELDPHCLNHVCIETNGKPRKIASTCIENVRKYLLNM
jgi:hypothetical protein